MVRKSVGIIVRRVHMPRSELDEEIDWLLRSLGFCEGPDDVATDIFRSVLRGSYAQEGIHSSDIRARKKLSHGAVVYHLNSFINRGLFVREGRNYRLRAGTLHRSVEELEEDVLRTFAHLKKVAKDIDERMARQAQSNLPTRSRRSYVIEVE